MLCLPGQLVTCPSGNVSECTSIVTWKGLWINCMRYFTSVNHNKSIIASAPPCLQCCNLSAWVKLKSARSVRVKHTRASARACVCVSNEHVNPTPARHAGYDTSASTTCHQLSTYYWCVCVCSQDDGVEAPFARARKTWMSQKQKPNEQLKCTQIPELTHINNE